MATEHADPLANGACALCGRRELPLAISLITRPPGGGRQAGWACVECAASYPDHTALVVALFRRLAGGSADADPAPGLPHPTGAGDP